jgi:hypothetical protein
MRRAAPGSFKPGIEHVSIVHTSHSLLSQPFKTLGNIHQLRSSEDQVLDGIRCAREDKRKREQKKI